jgi:hypothetical protein
MRRPGEMSKMIKKIIQLCIVGAISVLAVGAALGQTTTSASATGVSSSSGTPSSFRIRANILAQKQAAIEQQIEVAQRCVKNATLPTVLRDPEGNLRTVPLTDVVNCTRTLKSLQRQLVSLAREADRLTRDAEATAFRLERAQQRALARARLQGQPN